MRLQAQLGDIAFALHITPGFFDLPMLVALLCVGIWSVTSIYLRMTEK